MWHRIASSSRRAIKHGPSRKRIAVKGCETGLNDLYEPSDGAPAFFDSRSAGPDRHRRSREGDAAWHADPSLAVYLAGRPCRSQDARRLVDGAVADRQGRDACGAVHLQMGDRRADRCGYRASAGRELVALADRIAAHHDAELRRHTHRYDGAHSASRRAVCQGRDACGAQACLSDLRSHA